MSKLKPQHPLILRIYRLMDAFAKSDDERDFYLDHLEGFIIFVDLDKTEEDLELLQKELKANSSRYALIPKLTFFEVKKIMEGFVGEKVYDIDTKEKLTDIIGAKDSRDQFLEFIYDQETELEKWHQYYQERSRVRIIEWLRQNQFEFVFEEDLELPAYLLEKLKMEFFEPKVSKEVQSARATLIAKAKTYYSKEALNPRPKRGRPPKQSVKIEVDSQVSSDIYTQVPAEVRRFLYIPQISSGSEITFSEKYETEADFLSHLRGSGRLESERGLAALSEKFASLKKLSNKLGLSDQLKLSSFDEDEEDEEDLFHPQKKKPKKTINVQPMTPRARGKKSKE